MFPGERAPQQNGDETRERHDVAHFGNPDSPAQVEPPPAGALAGERLRVFISTDIGGWDEDDFQSLVHYFVYADVFDTEGIIASPPGPGTLLDILRTIDIYEKDYPNLRTWSDRYPSPAFLRSVSKQGSSCPYFHRSLIEGNEGVQWLIECARKPDPRPLYVLLWGCPTDLALALAEAPDIKPKLRVHFIAGWNEAQDPTSMRYIEEEHSDIWLIQDLTTFQGWRAGGNMTGDLDNRRFVLKHVKGHGALGDFFASLKGGAIKMGDTPTVSRLLRGDPEDPTADSWGGRFVRRTDRPNWFIDDPDPSLMEKEQTGQRRDWWGAKTLSKYREQWLRDWQARMDRCKQPRR